MGGIDSFSGFDSLSQGFSPDAFEKFKERMAASAAQLKAMQADEKKKKKKEEDLAKILLAFIKSGAHTEIAKLIVELLAINLPAGFIVSLILISHPEIQAQSGMKLLSAPETNTVDNQNTLPDLYIKEFILPLRVKITIDSWVQEIAIRAEEYNVRILDRGRLGGKIHPTIIKLAAHCFGDYLIENNLNFNLPEALQFCELFLGGIYQKLLEGEQKRLN